jgi:hypothetical protein
VTLFQHPAQNHSLLLVWITLLGVRLRNGTACKQEHACDGPLYLYETHVRLSDAVFNLIYRAGVLQKISVYIYCMADLGK